MSVSDKEYNEIVSERDQLKSALRSLISCVDDLGISKPDIDSYDADRTSILTSVGAIRILWIIREKSREFVI